MLSYHARQLLALSYDGIWTLPDVKENLVTFDDDTTLVLSTREIIFSYYMWWPHQEWPTTPLLPEHAISEHLTSNLLLRLMERSAFSAYDAMAGTVDVEYLGLRIKQELNRIYNDLTTKLEAYVTGLDALDFVSVIRHPAIKAANDTLQAKDLENPGVLANMEIYIDETHNAILKVLMNDEGLKGNRLSEVVRSEIVSSGQVLQCVGPRGYPSDIDSHIFKQPIVRGFGHGIFKLHDHLIESRSAAKALFFTKDPLQTTEYFNREMQLNTATLKTLYYEDDCGSTEYVPWTITKKNLNITAGLWQCDPEDNQLKLITRKRTDLIGRTVLLRSAMTCKHRDAYGICGKCYGELRLAVPRGTNIGHVSVTELCAMVSQNVLSTKHLDRTASIGAIVLTPYDRQFIRLHEGQLQLAISKVLTDSQVSIIVNKEDVSNLADLNIVSDLRQLSISKISAMDEVSFSVIDEDGDLSISPVSVNMGSRKASFTVEFLQHIRDVGYSIEGDRSIAVSLSKWDFSKPVWILPRKHANMLDFLNEIKSNIKASGKNRGKEQLDLTETVVLAEALTDLYDLVSQKFNINLTHLATILKSTMIRSKKENDYRMPIANGSRELGTYRDIITMRSLSALAAYQEQFKTFYDPRAYTVKTRPPHPFDPILLPSNSV